MADRAAALGKAPPWADLGTAARTSLIKDESTDFPKENRSFVLDQRGGWWVWTTRRDVYIVCDMSRGGDLVREGRRRRGLTQAELADLVGTSQSAIARWENGGTSPSLDTTLRVLRTMGLDLDYQLVEYDDSDIAQAERLLGLTPQQRADHLVGFVATMRGLREGAQSSTA